MFHVFHLHAVFSSVRKAVRIVSAAYPYLDQYQSISGMFSITLYYSSPVASLLSVSESGISQVPLESYLILLTCCESKSNTDCGNRCLVMPGFRISRVGEKKACSVSKIEPGASTVRTSSILDDLAVVDVFDLWDIDWLGLNDINDSLSSPIFDIFGSFERGKITLIFLGDLVGDISESSSRFLVGAMP
jgi:hypothetical protein